ncbi:MAG: GNAT family N-acetyltransferase [Dehalococcoidia bacterium]
MRVHLRWEPPLPRKTVMERPTSPHENAIGQPVGAPLPDWAPRPFPARETMRGRTCRLEPLDPARHADDLFAAFAEDAEGRTWTYLPYGPFASREEHRAWLREISSQRDPQFYAIVDEVTGRAIGQASYLRIDPPNGAIEVGHLAFAPALQRTTAATEAMYLMMRRAFDEYGYRRYEWKCDSLNDPSWSAAERLGFTFEGIFRQATVPKQRNRDTTWLSILDGEWPALRDALEGWLAAENFEADGRQRRSLLDFQRETGARATS